MIQKYKSYQQETYEIIFTYNNNYMNIYQYLMMSIYLSDKQQNYTKLLALDK